MGRFDTFAIGMRVRRAGAGVLAVHLVADGTPGVVIRRDARDQTVLVQFDNHITPLWFGEDFGYENIEPLPADPPSVGVPAQGTVVQSALMRSAGLGPASVAHDYAQQQMAAQRQQVDSGVRPFGAVADDWVSGKEHAALKAELEKERLARKQFGERVRELNAQLTEATGAKFRVGDLMGDCEKLRREKADLETQVAYLTRELVLAKARAKGSR